MLPTYLRFPRFLGPKTLKERHRHIFKSHPSVLITMSRWSLYLSFLVLPALLSVFSFYSDLRVVRVENGRKKEASTSAKQSLDPICRQSHALNDIIGQTAPDNEYNAVIVGAGFAGLKAVHTLNKRNITNVLLLEARNRVGGRAYSVPVTDDINFEMGCEWTYEWGKLPKLFEKFGIQYGRPTRADRYKVYYDGGVLRDAPKLRKRLFSKGFIPYLNKEGKRLRNSNLPDRSMEEVLQDYLQNVTLTNFERQFLEMDLNQFLVVDYGAPLSRLSANSTGDHTNGEGFFGLTYTAVPNGGFGRLTQELAARVHEDTKIALGAKVTKIDRSLPGKVIVSYIQDGAFKQVTTDTTAVTVPLGVLKHGDIEFYPPLNAAKQAAIDGMYFGNLEKISMHWDEAFWPTDLEWLGMMTPKLSTTGIYTGFLNPTALNGGTPILVGWIAGDDARAVLNANDDEGILSIVLANLRSMFPSITVPRPKMFRVSRWCQDEFARGSYTVKQAKRSFKADAAALQASEGRVFFAGEATGSGYPGTTEAAYSSGTRVAMSLEMAIKCV